MKIRYATCLALLLSLIACSGNKEKAEKVDITQITYQEFYELMFEDYENRVEWHHESYNDEAKTEITIGERGDCKTENCGKQVFVKNTSSDKKIEVVVNTSFSIPNSPEYLATKFVLEPGAEQYLTCTKFCFNDETYQLDQEVVIAKYVVD